MFNHRIQRYAVTAILLIAGAANFLHSQEPGTTHAGHAVLPGLSTARPVLARSILSHRDSPMAEAFRTRKLPAALPVPPGDRDQAAAELAQRIAAADSNSTGALITAIRLSGFSIRGATGGIVAEPFGYPQGLALDAHTIAATAKLYSDGWAISLPDLGLVLSKAFPALRGEQITESLRAGIVHAAEGDQPLRFWARTIVELGRRSNPPSDFLDPARDPSRIELNAIQVTFVLQRLIGELLAQEEPKAPVTRRFNGQGPHMPAAQLESAMFHPSRGFRLIRVADSGSGDASPCTLGDGALTALDGNAIAQLTEWKNLIDLEKQAEKAGLAARANVLLTLLKFIVTYAFMNLDITMDNPPLVRTTDTDPGQSRTLTAHIWFEFQNWQLLNCMRPLLNVAGLDFGNIPNHGDAEGVGVEWVMLKGGVPNNVTTKNIPALLEAHQSAIVMFDNGPGSDGATWNKVTDEHGRTSITVSGRPQPMDITNMKKFPINKQMAIGVNIAYKHNGSAEKMLGELVDVLGPALGFSSGDVLGGLTGAATETLFRMHWFSSKVFEFPVQDWVPCHDGWGGTITFTKSLHTVQQIPSPPNLKDATQTAINTSIVDERGTLVLSGGNVHGSFGESDAKWSLTVNNSRLYIGHFSGKNQCGPVIRDYRSEATTSGSDSLDAKVQVVVGDGQQIGESGWYYTLTVGSQPAHFSFKSTNRTVQNASKWWMQCRPDNGESDYPGNAVVSYQIPVYMLHGKVDPKHPNEIHDTQTTTDKFLGITTVINIDLVRCDM